MKKILSLTMICLVVFSALTIFTSPVKSQPEKLASGESVETLTVDSQYVYFTELYAGRIQKVSKSGGASTTLATGIQRVTEITCDSEYIYYVDQGWGYNGKVIRMGKNGENPTALANNLIWAWGITLDEDYVYFTEGQVHVTTGYVKKVPKTGGTTTTLAVVTNPHSVIVDSDYVYFPTDIYTASNIRRVNKDGTNLVTLASGLQRELGRLALDSGYVYFAEYTGHEPQPYLSRIGRLPKNGGIIQILASGQANTWDVTVDSDFAYFTECGAGNIKKVAKNGGTIETLAGGYPHVGGQLIVESNCVYYSVVGYTGEQAPLNGVYRLQLIMPATVNIDPDTLNLKSNGQWITANITLSEEYNLEDIVLETVYLDRTPAVWSEIQNGVYMVKFDREAVQSSLTNEPDYESAPKFYDSTLTVTGELVDGTPFQGSDTIRILSK